MVGYHQRRCSRHFSARRSLRFLVRIQICRAERLCPYTGKIGRTERQWHSDLFFRRQPRFVDARLLRNRIEYSSLSRPKRICFQWETFFCRPRRWKRPNDKGYKRMRSEEHTSELQSRPHLVCRLLLEKK